MNTGFRTLSIPFRSIHRLIQSVLPQLRFSFYRHQLLCADFSGVQALNPGDLDALVALYAIDGFLMARSGPARGIGAIRKALAEYVAMKPALPTHYAQSRAIGGHGAACGRLAISRNRRRWQRCGNLWNEYRSGSSSAGWELALPHRSSLRAQLIHMPRIYDVSGHPVLVLNRLQVNPATKRKRIVGGRNANGADSSNLGCFLILLGVVR